MQTTIFLSPESASASSLLLLPLDTLDASHDACRALEVEDGVLQLLVDHIAVAHHDYRVEDLLMLGIMEIREEVRRPCNRVRLP